MLDEETLFEFLATGEADDEVREEIRRSIEREPFGHVATRIRFVEHYTRRCLNIDWSQFVPYGHRRLKEQLDGARPE